MRKQFIIALLVAIFSVSARAEYYTQLPEIISKECVRVNIDTRHDLLSMVSTSRGIKDINSIYSHRATILGIYINKTHDKLFIGETDEENIYVATISPLYPISIQIYYKNKEDCSDTDSDKKSISKWIK